MAARGENAALSFHQDIARIGGDRRDESDPAGLSRGRLTAYPFCQGARFAKAAAGE